jgi:probable phosphoglycerate mutase
MRLFVVVHCQSVHQVERQVGGWYDSSLTGLGRRHAKAVANALDRYLTTAQRQPQLFSSDLERARETAEYIAPVIGCDVRLRKELRQMSWGVAEGESESWLAEHGQAQPLEGDMLHYKPCDGAESRFELARRIYPFIAALIERGDPDTVIVTHKHAHDAVVAAWLGMPKETLGRFRIGTVAGCITRLVVDPVTRLATIDALNDHAHLDLIAESGAPQKGQLQPGITAAGFAEAPLVAG